jgi:hypothetical protein
VLSKEGKDSPLFVLSHRHFALWTHSIEALHKSHRHFALGTHSIEALHKSHRNFALETHSIEALHKSHRHFALGTHSIEALQKSHRHFALGTHSIEALHKSFISQMSLIFEYTEGNDCVLLNSDFAMLFSTIATMHCSIENTLCLHYNNGQVNIV